MCGVCMSLDLLVVHEEVCEAVHFPPGAALTLAEEAFLDTRVLRQIRDLDRAAPADDAGAAPAAAPDWACPICLEGLPEGPREADGGQAREGEKPAVPRTRTTVCGHTFCDECISKWFEVSTCCPVCKSDMAEHGGYRLVDSPAPGLAEEASSWAYTVNLYGDPGGAGDTGARARAMSDLLSRIDCVLALIGPHTQ